jgi:hypothetical protein
MILFHGCSMCLRGIFKNLILWTRKILWDLPTCKKLLGYNRMISESLICLTCQIIISDVNICIRNFFILYFFLHPVTHPPDLEMLMSSRVRAHIFTQNWQIICETVGEVFSIFLPKIKYANSICKLNCWRCLWWEVSYIPFYKNLHKFTQIYTKRCRQ